MAEIELFSFSGCPYAQRSRMVLIEKGLPFRLTEVDLFDRPAWFSEVSPYGKVPVLRHAGGTVYESAIINEYLDEAFPDPPLLPSSKLARAQARIWMHYCDSRLLPAGQQLMGSSGQAADRAEKVAALTEILRFMEHEGLRKLGEGPYWFGRQLTLTDIHFAPFIERFGVHEALDGARWPEDCPRLDRWRKALAETAGGQATALPLATHIEMREQMQKVIAARRSNAAKA